MQFVLQLNCMHNVQFLLHEGVTCSTTTTFFIPTAMLDRFSFSFPFRSLLVLSKTYQTSIHINYVTGILLPENCYPEERYRIFATLADCHLTGLLPGRFATPEICYPGELLPDKFATHSICYLTKLNRVSLPLPTGGGKSSAGPLRASLYFGPGEGRNMGMGKYTRQSSQHLLSVKSTSSVLFTENMDYNTRVGFKEAGTHHTLYSIL